MLLNNRYRVLQTLGGGGFGDTFLAEDTQMPSLRRCVIKQLRLIHNNPQVYQLVQARFQREAAILEELGDKCEQIPSLYAYFQEDEKFYLVQEWIEGDTLTARIQKQGIFSETAVQNLLINLLPILDSIHARGIIHRDIKPDNVILRSKDERPVLIDFGAVRESMGTVVNSQGSPTSSIVIGTPGFMPSEQAMGRPVYVSDIYSLGITVIYLLTGKQPHELPTDPRTGELVWHNYAPYLSPQMRSLLEKAIAYHPRDRFNNAQEMLFALKAIQTSSIPTVASQAAVTPNPTFPHTSPQTIPISPAATQINQPSISSPQVAPTTNKMILFGAIIAAGLVSIVAMISFALNRQPNSEQQIAQENRILSPTSPASTTPLANSTPIASPTEISRQPQFQAPSQTVAPPVINPIEPSQNPITPEPSIQPETPPVIETPITELTPSPTPTPPASTPTSSPEEFVRSYYSAINSGNFEASWNQLSSTFRNNRQLHPQGYNSYIDWWGGKVANVQVNQLQIVDSQSDTATIDAKLNYNLKSGGKSPSDVRFYLVWNPSDRRWIIRDVQRLRG